MLKKIYNLLEKEELKASLDIDQLVKDYSKQINATDFGYAVGVNDTVAHTIDCTTFKKGDIISVDTWFKVGNSWIDGAITSSFGGWTLANDLIDVTRSAVVNGFHELNRLYRREGKIRLNQYGAFIDTLDMKGYKVITSLSGHNITDALHGGLKISSTYRDDQNSFFEIGRRYALETLVNSSGEFDRDSWKSSDGSNSAHWEITVDMTESGLVIVYGKCS